MTNAPVPRCVHRVPAQSDVDTRMILLYAYNPVCRACYRHAVIVAARIRRGK